VALFRVIQHEGDLPAEGAGAERLSFDLKQTYGDPPDREEMAKDMAAFANASGGVVLVGVVEDQRHGVVGRYFPLDRAAAQEVKRTLSEAVRDFCSPIPLVDVAVVFRGSGFVVAANVSPFPAQAVGVRSQQTANSYCFPLRTATDTAFIRPEQLAMLMLPEVRRVVIHLSAIKVPDKIVIVFKSPNVSPSPPVRWEFEFEELRMLDNVVALLSDPPSRERLLVPLDQIRTVWRELVNRWCIVVAGRVVKEGNRFFYSPE
jgi:hypothetical protein